MFAIVGVLFAAFWRKPLDLLEAGAAKVKAMTAKKAA